MFLLFRNHCISLLLYVIVSYREAVMLSSSSGGDKSGMLGSEVLYKFGTITFGESGSC